MKNISRLPEQKACISTHNKGVLHHRGLAACSSEQGHGGVEEKEGCCDGKHLAHLAAFQLVGVVLVSSMAGNVPYVFSSVLMPRFCFSSPTQTQGLI